MLISVKPLMLSTETYFELGKQKQAEGLDKLKLLIRLKITKPNYQICSRRKLLPIYTYEQ